MTPLPTIQDLVTFSKQIDKALNLLTSGDDAEQPLFTDDHKKTLQKGLLAAKALNSDLLALVQISQLNSGGSFIPSDQGAIRAEAFQTWVATNISVPVLRNVLSVNNFAVDANNIRLLLGSEEVIDNSKPDRLLIYPALNNGNFTLVFTAANKSSEGLDKVSHTIVDGIVRVLDEIDPCKGSDCPKIK